MMPVGMDASAHFAGLTRFFAAANKIKRSWTAGNKRVCFACPNPQGRRCTLLHYSCCAIYAKDQEAPMLDDKCWQRLAADLTQMQQLGAKLGARAGWQVRQWAARSRTVGP